MKVFKFGGASIKSAQEIRNIVTIVEQYQHEKLIIIVSAMGKSTNVLEELIDLSISGKNYNEQFSSFKKYHRTIIDDLALGTTNVLHDKITDLFAELNSLLTQASGTNYAELYDSIVSYGELISSTIVNYCLNESDIKSCWIDARNIIITDDTFQDGKVNWKLTADNINNFVQNEEHAVFLTQGFIGSTSDSRTTTLGREGSDYTAAIFASCLNAESVTVWKDVPGILNADPKIINDAILFKELPYNEASEMTFYGAKVIHPKTIKPLANKQIPLYVRCFETPETEGTVIHNCVPIAMPPVIIYKENQCLVSFIAKDLSFVNEHGLSIIFGVLHELDLNIHIMQNSAISFTACMDYNAQKIDQLIAKLDTNFSIRYNANLQLVTIKNYTQEALEKYKPTGTHLLEQISRSNYRVLIHAD